LAEEAARSGNSGREEVFRLLDEALLREKVADESEYAEEEGVAEARC